MQKFTGGVAADAVMDQSAAFFPGAAVRSYGLRSPAGFYPYIRDVSAGTQGLRRLRAVTSGVQITVGGLLKKTPRCGLTRKIERFSRKFP
ncbi:MAG: hypothetical protein ACM3WV_03445 [Bacillota bacterium]